MATKSELIKLKKELKKAIALRKELALKKELGL